MLSGASPALKVISSTSNKSHIACSLAETIEVCLGGACVSNDEVAVSSVKSVKVC